MQTSKCSLGRQPPTVATANGCRQLPPILTGKVKHWSAAIGATIWEDSRHSIHSSHKPRVWQDWFTIHLKTRENMWEGVFGQMNVTPFGVTTACMIANLYMKNKGTFASRLNIELLVSRSNKEAFTSWPNRELGVSSGAFGLESFYELYLHFGESGGIF